MDGLRFPTSYANARRTFLAQCARTGAAVESIAHPLAGPEGALFMDVATWGAADAARLVIVSSGTHGIEGYAGSGIQTALLAEGLAPPTGTQLAMVHAINPFGFAWQRRVNEDNVDLNRNFVDHARVGGRNRGYDDLAELLEPAEWNAAAVEKIRQGLAAYARAHGQRALQAALSGGQYAHPNGFFYGGRTPGWSRREILRVAERDWRAPREVVMVDIHTALGAFGAGECIVECAPGAKAHARARALWGDRVRSTQTGESESAAVEGSMISGLGRLLGDRFIGTGLEFGTVEVGRVLMALVADQWLHRYGAIDSDAGRAIKVEMMDVFCPDSSEWRCAVTDIAREVVASALRGA